MYHVAMYVLISIMFGTVLWMVLPGFRWFRKLCGGRWYRLRDRRSPSDDHYWSRFLDEKNSCVMDVEDYDSDDLGNT